MMWRTGPAQEDLVAPIQERIDHFTDLSDVIRLQPAPTWRETVPNRLHSAGYYARRPIKRPLLTRQHKVARLAWCRERRRWNLANWRKVHWSDESRFLLFKTDGRTRVWRQRNSAYAQRNIMEQVPFGGGSIMVWGCVSHDCKLDLVTVRGNLNAAQYQRDILDRVVVPHFDNHPLLTRSIFMDDNARPHRARAVVDFLHQEAITTLPWPARSPDLNPIEHVWDFLGTRVRQRVPPVQNLHELEQALHQEWNRLPQRQIQRLVQGMRRRVEAVIQAYGGYTRYWLLLGFQWLYGCCRGFHVPSLIIGLCNHGNSGFILKLVAGTIFGQKRVFFNGLIKINLNILSLPILFFWLHNSSWNTFAKTWPLNTTKWWQNSLALLHYVEKTWWCDTFFQVYISLSPDRRCIDFFTACSFKWQSQGGFSLRVGIRVCACHLGCIFSNFGIAMGGFSARTNPPN